MTESLFISVDEAAEILGVARSTAYKIIRQMNKELDAQHYQTIAGKVSRQYFMEQFYGLKTAN